MPHNQHTVVLYHADCLDGFGGAYAAWKKFGDSAEYIPCKHGHAPVMETIENKDVYFMDDIRARAKSLTVLDHHEGVQAVVASVPNHVYDANRSGSTIAWSYFHPDTPAPTLLKHMEDEDLYRFALPETRAIGVYMNGCAFSFPFWDEVAAALEDPEKKQAVLSKADAYLEYFNHLIELSVEHAHPVLFEGYRVLLANTSPMKTLKSAVGNALTKKMPPFGLVMSVHPNGRGVSIRGDGSVDMTTIAQKYGGNGHPKSSGFVIPWPGEMPFTSAEEHSHEDTRD